MPDYYNKKLPSGSTLAFSLGVDQVGEYPVSIKQGDKKVPGLLVVTSASEGKKSYVLWWQDVKNLSDATVLLTSNEEKSATFTANGSEMNLAAVPNALKNAATIPSTAAEPAAPAAGTPARPAVSKRSSQAPEAPAAPAAQASGDVVKAFLEKHKGLYKGEGGTVDELLASYAKFISGRLSSAVAKDLDGKIASTIEKIKGKDSWDGGVELFGLRFSEDEGLVSFLQIAYVATHQKEQPGYAAARKIGLDPAYSGYFPTDPAWKVLCLLGAISSSPFMILQLPDAGVQAGDTLRFVPGDQTSYGDEKPLPAEGIEYEFANARNGGTKMLLSMGLEKEDPGEAGNGVRFTVANFFGPAFEKIRSRLGQQTLFTLSTGGRTYTTSAEIGVGMVVDFSRATLQASPQERARELSSEVITSTVTRRDITRPGVTQLDLQNVYTDANGSPSIQDVPVKLAKEVRRGTDIFTMSVQPPGMAAILVPIRLASEAVNESRLLREADVAHWTQAILGAPDATPANDTGVRYVALQEIEWQYDGNFSSYGGDATGIKLISYVPAQVTPDRLPEGVKLVAIDVAKRDGKPMGSFDPVAAAILLYLVDERNPTGTRLAMSSRLNAAMKSFPISTVISSR